MKKCVCFLLALTMLAAMGAVGVSAAEEWAPDSAVTVIVPYAAGNSSDITARVLCECAEKYVGQSVVIKNVDGEGGAAGWSELAQAEPDGLTIGFLNLPNFNGTIVSGAGDYTVDDFVPICNHVTETSLVIVRASDDRFETLDDLAAYGREHSGKNDPDMLKASTNGEMASNHIGAQAFANSAGFAFIDVPKSGTTDQMLSLRSREADFCVAKVADITGRDVDLRVLGAFSEKRVSEYPDAPTLGELGYYDKWLGSYRCIVAPAGTPEEAIAFYEEVFRLVMNDSEYLAAAEEAGIATDYQDAEATAALIEQQQEFTEGLEEDFWSE